MLRLFRSDMYRLVRGKMMWVIPLVLVAWVALMTYVTWFAVTEFGSDIMGNTSSALVDVVTGQLTQHMDLSMQFGSSLIAQGGLLVVLACIFAALFAAFDADTGFIKNIFPARRGRVSYFAEKFVLIALACLVFTLFGAAAFYIAMSIAGFGFAPFLTAPVLRWFAVVWFLVAGYAFLCAAIAWLSRSKALGCVFAVLLSTSFVGTVLMGVFLLMPESDISRVALDVLDWMPFKSLSALGTGAAAFDPNGYAVDMGIMGVLSFTPSMDGGMWPESDMPAIVHVCITAAGMWLLAIVLTLGFAARRDV